MKPRHLPAMHTAIDHRTWRGLPWLAALLLACGAGAALAQPQAQPDADPPARVATVSYREGSVVFAPQGEADWIELPQNRPLTDGDRIWSDQGARAELQLGSATLHLDALSHLGIAALDDHAARFILVQGSVNARVRDLAAGENFEIGTPNLALRAARPGDYRIDVDPQRHATRIVVASGLATLYGEAGQSLQLGAGEQASFTGRALEQLRGGNWQGDAFGQWAAERNRLEDQSIAARHVPRGVVGYSQLDAYGSWAQDPDFGAVWFPQPAAADWAPYRDGHWSWIDPWGWTWIDDEPWGFAPFHYGRWALIGARWAWVPGRMAARPVYAPALVVFLGTGPGVGWYPLAPGEAWYPAYRTSPRYVNFANFNINLRAYPRNFANHLYRHRASAVTAVREDDFRNGRSVRSYRQPLQPSAIGQARIGVAPARPERQLQPASGAQQPPRFQREQPRAVQQEQSRMVQQEPGRRVQQEPAWNGPQGRNGGWERDRLVREQAQAQREQARLQREADRAAREQQRQAAQDQQQQSLARQQREALRRQQEQPLRQQAQPQQRRQVQPDAREGRGEGRWQRDDDGLARDRSRGRWHVARPVGWVRAATPPSQRRHGGVASPTPLLFLQLVLRGQLRLHARRHRLVVAEGNGVAALAAGQ
jgi:hypothetical protein